MCGSLRGRLRGLRTEIDEARESQSSTTTFGDDYLGRLISEERVGDVVYHLEYEYDVGGNRLKGGRAGARICVNYAER